MKSLPIVSAALICSIMISGCGANGLNHTARSQSYQNMGNQGYHISPGQNSASTQNITGQSNLYSRKLNSEIDINKSHQLEAKLNRAGVSAYSVLVAGNTVFLGHAYPAPQRTLNTGTMTTTSPDSGTAMNTGFGSTTTPNSSPTSQTGFGTPSSPMLNNPSGGTNGVPIEQLQTKNTPQSINQNVNKTSQIPVNPSYTRNGGDSQVNSGEIYKARGIIEDQMGKNTDVFFIHDQAGVNAMTSIKQKVNKKGTSQAASFEHELKILEAEINR